jgi:hypothetical protein
LSSSWQSQNAIWVRSRKRCIKWWNGTENSISDLWLSQNAIRVKSRKWCF